MNDVGIRLTADGKGATQELRSVADTLDKVGAATKSAANETKLIGQVSREASAQAEAYIKSLKEQAATLGMTSLQMKAYQGDQMKLSETQKQAAIDSITRIARYEEEQQAVKELSTAAKGLALTVAGVAAGFALQVKHQIDAAAGMQTLSEKTGESVDQLSRLKYAADLSDTSINTVARAMQQLPKSIAEARNADSNAGRAFSFLGIDPSSLKTQQQAIDAIADSITRVQDPMAKAAALQFIFKHSGEELIPFFNNGAAGLRKLGDEGARWAEISGVTAEKSKILKDQVVALNYAQAEFSKLIAATTVGPMTQWLEQLIAARKETGGLVSAVLLLGTQDPFKSTALAQVDAYRERLAGLNADRQRYLSSGSDVRGIDDAIRNTQSRLNAAKLVQRQEVEEMYRGQDYGDVISRRFGARAITGSAEDLGRERKGKTSNAGENEFQSWMKQATQARAQFEAQQDNADRLTEAEKKLASFREMSLQGLLKMKPVEAQLVEMELEMNAAAERGAANRKRDMANFIADLKAGEEVTLEINRFNAQQGDAANAQEISWANATKQARVAAIADPQARAQAGFELDMQREHERLSTIYVGVNRKKELEDAFAKYQVARTEQLAEELKPPYQKMLDGWTDNTRLMRDSWNSTMSTVLSTGESVFKKFVATGKFQVKDLGNAIRDEFASLVYRKSIAAPLASAADSVLGGLFKSIGLGGGGGAPAGDFSAAGFGLSEAGIAFANGGIMTSGGPVSLRKYSSGGVANSPQLAMFGEGSTAEAYVPLPDGRRIPVVQQGGGGTTISAPFSVSIDARGSAPGTEMQIAATMQRLMPGMLYEHRQKLSALIAANQRERRRG